MTQSTRTTLVLVATCISVLVFFYTLFTASVSSPIEETTQEVIATTSVAQMHNRVQTHNAPERIVIPRLGTDALVQHVGIAKSGNMAVPTNYTDVGWFREGTLPGNVGSAVIDGHVDNGLGLPGVFARLHELVAGDTIYIETREGERLPFVVEEVASYQVDEVPRERVFNKADAARLNLITCEGEWIQEEKMYDQRLVVYARLAE